MGVSPENQHLYDVSDDGTWRCLLDLSIVLQAHQINDNFCDCPDGSDEPGTNACEFTEDAPRYFYCANEGYLPKYVENFKVNDGVCDYDVCCDGSDEYLSGKCENRCGEVMQQYQNYINDRGLAMVNALKFKDELVAMARVNKAKLEEKVASMKSELQSKTQDLERLNQQLKEAEDDEANDENFSQSILNELASYAELIENQFSQLFASSNAQKERVAQLEQLLADLVKNYNPNFNDLSVKQCVKLFEEYISNKPHESENQPTLEKFKEGFASLAEKLKLWLPVSTPESLLEKISSAEKDLNAQMADFSIHDDSLQKDYGPNEILRAVEGEWVNKKIGEYTYKLGFLDAIYQDNTLVGRFANFDGSSLHYTQGSKCWNGPQRSAVVQIVCGPLNDLVSVSEPEKCQYKFILESPIGCSQMSNDEIGESFKVDTSGFN
ncbi:CIC11C00000004453 [Sungouiella intermedia]|uniref:Glucosidase 2 subunit beta n=1 Tax=Sungouiella intermedia TaxID=45354 RepID=A0A1L0BFF3_9ASCO|nr:CIC11C00000004453 [[Candida] intermedia]